MLPSILAGQLQKDIADYIESTFPMTNEPFKGSVQEMLENKASLYHEPYITVRLPFRAAEEMPACFEAIHPAYLPNAEYWRHVPCQRRTCDGFLEEYETGEISYLF